MSNSNLKSGSKILKISIAFAIAVVLILSVTIGALSISAIEQGKTGLVFSSDFDGTTKDDVTGKEGSAKGNGFYNNALRINNDHKSGNSMLDALSYVQYDGLKKIEKSDFTIAFDYFANEPSDIFSTILSTGQYGLGLNIFNKAGLGISFGHHTMKADVLSEEERNHRAVRLDSFLLNDDRWHSILITADRDGDMNLYVDGFFREKMDISESKDVAIENSTLIFGANANLRYGSEDMFIDNVRVFNKICDKNGNDLFGDSRWLLAEKRGQRVAKDYRDLADADVIAALERAIQEKRPQNKDEVESSVNSIMTAIQNVVASAKSKEVMNFQVLADTHMMTTNISSMNSFIDALKNIGEWYSDTSALVVAGDLTDNGYDSQYDKYYGALRQANTAPYTMNITGNHESGFNDTTVIEDNERFMRYNNAYMKDTYNTDEYALDKVYYDHWVGGYHFIALGSESENPEDLQSRPNPGQAYLSSEQFDFLEAKLAEVPQGKEYDPRQPIFVFNHQPLEGTTPNSTELGVGPDNVRLKQILANYPQVVYVSGHVHNGYVGEEATYNGGFGMLIDTPCLRANEVVRYGKSIGYTFSIYEGNKIIVTPVNFTDDDVMYDMTIIVDNASRETLTSNYDIEVSEIRIDGVLERNNNLTDAHNHTYSVFEANQEIEYQFNAETDVCGVRIGTTYWNKPSEIQVCFSEDGVEYSAWESFKLNVSVNLQKIFFNTHNVKSMKFRFAEKSNIVMMTPAMVK